MIIGIDEINKILGLDLDASETIRALERTGYDAKPSKGKGVQVWIAKYRMDILHPVDIIEDIAIGFGFDRIRASMPQTMTTGKVSSLTRLKSKVRSLMVGM